MKHHPRYQLISSFHIALRCAIVAPATPPRSPKTPTAHQMHVSAPFPSPSAKRPRIRPSTLSVAPSGAFVHRLPVMPPSLLPFAAHGAPRLTRPTQLSVHACTCGQPTPLCTVHRSTHSEPPIEPPHCPLPLSRRHESARPLFCSWSKPLRELVVSYGVSRHRDRSIGRCANPGSVQAGATSERVVTSMGALVTGRGERSPATAERI